jgi:hypothetical protein
VVRWLNVAGRSVSPFFGVSRNLPLSGRPAGGCKPQPLASIRLSGKSISDNAHRHSSKARSRSKVWYSTQSHECPCSANYPRDHRTAHSRRFRVHLVDSVGSRHCRRVLFLVLCAAQKTAEVKFSKSLFNLPALRAADGNAGGRGETYVFEAVPCTRSGSCAFLHSYTVAYYLKLFS